MYLSSETSTIKTGKPILIELIHLVKAVIIFFIPNNLNRIVNFTARIMQGPMTLMFSPAFLDLLFSHSNLCFAMTFFLY